MSRGQPGVGTSARLFNRAAYRWYLGTIWGLAYQIFEIVAVWTNNTTVTSKILGTVLLVVFYVAYVALPPLIWSYSVRRRVLLLSLYWAATFVLLPVIGVYLVWVWPLVIAMIAFSWLPAAPTFLMSAGIVIAQLLVWVVDRFNPNDGVVFSPFVTVTVLVSLFAITRQIISNQRMRDAQTTIASLAAAEERARLARDLHDVLGHSLTVVAVKSELAGRLVELDPERAKAEIADIESLARTALTDLRVAVTSYRETNLDSELSAARTALEAAGIRSHLPVDGSPVDAPLRPLFGWVVREGVTNVIRHSGATQCWVELSSRTLRVRDDGNGPFEEAAGNGLTGLRERAREAGAKLTAEGAAGGFVLTVEKVRG